MPTRILLGGVGAYVLGAAVWVFLAGFRNHGDEVELLNVACDPTRELWQDINTQFIATHAQETGQRVRIRPSHGGSGSQARAVIDGLDADVVTLALWTDTDAIRKAGLLDAGWEERFPNRSLPYVSTIVFVVRPGNPRAIRDWPDLARPGVRVITPNPKTSGNGKWSFLALWGSVIWRGGTEAEARDLALRVYRQVPILDGAARNATMTFAQRGIGDVHLTWENEAHLEVQEAGGGLEIVYPPLSVLAEPHVAVVDRNVDRKGTRAAAEAYLQFLYTEPAQEVIARHHHRPVHPAVAARYRDRFPRLRLERATTLVGSQNWDELQQRFFAEGGVFDQILAEGRR